MRFCDVDHTRAFTEDCIFYNVNKLQCINPTIFQ